jgi:AcrR family transcriptional regulator
MAFAAEGDRIGTTAEVRAPVPHWPATIRRAGGARQVTDTPSRRTQEQRRAETERRVLEAATALIARTGSRSVTLAQVGQAAGYSRGIVYHQFGSRERLVAAVLDLVQRMELPEYAGDGLEQLVGIVESYLRAVAGRTPAARAFLQLWMEAIAADPVVAPLFTERDAGFRRFLADVVRHGVADGSVRSDADPAAAGAVVMALLRGTSLQFIAEPPVDVDAVTWEAVRSVRAAFARPS